MSTALLLALIAAPAYGQEEACSGPLKAAHWREAMDAVDTSIAGFNGARARQILDDLSHELRCLDEPASPLDVGRMARQQSLLAFYDQDPAEAESWAVLARSTIGGAPWDAGIPVPLAYHEMVAGLPDPDAQAVADKGLVPPKKGAVLLDGWFLAGPTAELGTMHLLQVADKRGLVLRTLWQHGAAFPADLLGPSAQLSAPKWYAAAPAPAPLPKLDAIADADEPAPDRDLPSTPDPTLEAVEDPVEDVEPVDAASDVALPTGTRVAKRAPAVDIELKKKMFDTADPQEGCPWRKDPRTAEARAGEVQINKHSYPVKSTAEQDAFRDVLRSCGEFRAARRFTRWRDARRKLALDAGRYKKGMIKALITPDKPRAKKPE